MADNAINLLPELEREKESTALIGLLADETASENGRQISIANLAIAQQRERPLSLDIERVLLVSYTGVDANNRAVDDNATFNELDTGTWNDGFHEIEVYWRTSIAGNVGHFIDRIPISLFSAFNNPAEPRIEIQGHLGDRTITRSSDNSFILSRLSQSASRYISAIYGVKFVTTES